MAWLLDSARFQDFIAMELGVCVIDVNTMVFSSHLPDGGIDLVNISRGYTDGVNPPASDLG